MYCSKCGSETTSESKFCKECGNSLSASLPNDTIEEESTKSNEKSNSRKSLDAPVEVINETGVIKMTFTEAIQSVLKNYANFSGRARRSEYWYWNLAVIILYVLLAIVGRFSDALSVVIGLVFFASVIPSMTVLVRRLHDVDKSGWWLLLGLIPIFGYIIISIWNIQEGTKGTNGHGENPKTGVR